MKSGTTTLHYLLAAHEKVFIPVPEIYFFDIDDFEQHRNFFAPFGAKWRVQDYKRDLDKNLKWYRSFFTNAKSVQLVGEDTTTYLASRKAPARIAELLPQVKLIFILRNPVSRAYSQYWHMVETGATTETFENAISYNPSTILSRGHYREQLERFYKYFSSRQIKIVVFEQLITNIRQATEDVCHFLDIDIESFSYRAETHKNPANPPRSHRLQLCVNKLSRMRDSRRYLKHLPPGHDGEYVESTSFDTSRLDPWVSKLARHVLLKSNVKYSPMCESTKDFLQEYYQMENRGLSDLIGIDTRSYW